MGFATILVSIKDKKIFTSKSLQIKNIQQFNSFIKFEHLM